MPNDYVTIGETGPSPDEDIADGPYVVILESISQPETAPTPGSPYGDEWTFRRWTFRVNQTGSPYDGRKVEAALTLATGSKSNTYAYITALSGGIAPQPKQQIDLQELVGRQAVAQVYHKDEGGFPKIAQLSAIPPQMLQQQFAAATTTTAPPPAASATGDDLPF